MPSSLLSSAKDIIQQGRDYTQLVRQVKDILPQFSDDQVCDALVQSDEDITRAVDLLMSQQPMNTKSKKKKKDSKEKEKEKEKESEPEIPAEKEPEVRDERPKTQNEKEAAKLRKKLREIERIEEKLARGEKVDPLQLPKLEKKRETEDQILILEQKIQEEEEERRWQEQEMQKAQAQAQAPTWQYEAQTATAYAQPATHQIVAPQYPPPVEQPWLLDPPEAKHENMRAELLNMLHKTPPESGQYEHSKQLANQLSAGGRSTLHQMRSQSEGWEYKNYESHSRYQYSNQSQNWKSKQWREDGYWKEHKEHKERSQPEAGGNGEVKGDWANLYSTPLDVSSIPADKRAEAERIANEIEQNTDGWNEATQKGYRQNGKDGKNGKGKGKKGKGRDGKGKGREWKDWKDSSREWKEPARDWPKADWGPPGL